MDAFTTACPGTATAFATLSPGARRMKSGTRQTRKSWSVGFIIDVVIRDVL